ncbi:unnamed protein product [Fraxinus pennsylvanica]|uniref:adenylate kinase n=1 Tax=Fraxinus pennsylvanica TaxID=56036 RepID=A0AAD2AF59_9LAMI|nr:unnamed protein product [Fraxinus pennsylvanica]
MNCGGQLKVSGFGVLRLSKVSDDKVKQEQPEATDRTMMPRLSGIKRRFGFVSVQNQLAVMSILSATQSRREKLFSSGIEGVPDPPLQILLTRFSHPEDRNIQWVFLGCPGVGKGTYVSRFSTLLGVPYIATGDLVREELSSPTPLSKQLKEIANQGMLVSDEIIISLLSKRLEAGEANGESGFILDGFPRTVTQAEILDDVTDRH